MSHTTHKSGRKAFTRGECPAHLRVHVATFSFLMVGLAFVMAYPTMAAGF